MSDATATPSIADLVRLHGEKEFRRLIDVRWPHSQKAFITQLYEIFDEVVCALEENANQLNIANEEDLSWCVVSQLQRAGYSASAETHVRGHVDIKVNSSDGKRCWLGESKIHRKHEDLAEALLQLISRYATGRDPDGGILILVQKKGCDTVLNKWQEWLEDERFEGLKRIENDATPRCFRSVHCHDSAATYCVRHMGVHLYYEPRDKSGRSRKR